LARSARSSFLDGEIVVLGANGSPDFNALQNAFDRGRGADRIVYFVFDAPFFEGHDLREALPLRERRQLLKDFLAERATEHVRFSDNFDADPTSLLRSACQMQMEGVIAKRADAPYVSRRSETWLKLKCKLRQEFVICGYTDRTDGTAQVGSLLLGIHDASGKLVSVGSVGTGWERRGGARHQGQKLLPLAIRDNSPFAAGRLEARPVVQAQGRHRALGEAATAGRGDLRRVDAGRQIRHASFIGTARRQAAKAIVREIPKGSRRPGPTGQAETDAHAAPGVHQGQQWRDG
jgi:bifunctional non-homologous end joining protein LigD